MSLFMPDYEKNVEDGQESYSENDRLSAFTNYVHLSQVTVEDSLTDDSVTRRS